MPDSPLLLLVEDDPSIRDLMSRILKFEGFEVLTAAHGQDALELLDTLPELPELIILDLMMPVMDGWAFRKRQLQDPRLAELPTVIMTAGEEFSTECLQVQPEQLVPKQQELDSFLDSILRYVPRRELRRVSGFI